MTTKQQQLTKENILPNRWKEFCGFIWWLMNNEKWVNDLLLVLDIEYVFNKNIVKTFWHLNILQHQLK